MIIPSTLTPVTIVIYSSVPFTNKYEHHYYRPNFKKNNVSVPRVSYKQLLNQIYPTESINKHTMTGTYNFNYNNGLATTITLEVPSSFDSAMYMIVTAGTQDFYYFITNVTILNHTIDSVTGMITVKYDLELDVLATYETDFANSIKDFPVLVERKHCQRFVPSELTAIPYCSDYATNEPMISNCNPNVIKEVLQPDMNIEYLTKFIMKNTSNKLSDIKWLYISASDFDGIVYKMQQYTKLSIPNITLVIPLVTTFVLHWGSGADEKTITIDVEKFINEYYDAVGNYTAKVSPYPPFDFLHTNDITITTGTDSLGNATTTLRIDFLLTNIINVGSGMYSAKMSESRFYIQEKTDNKSYLMIRTQGKPEYDYNYVPLIEILTKPTASTLRNSKYEFKALMSPFTKYMLMAQYGEPLELHPEIVYSQVVPKNETITKVTGGTSASYTYMTLKSYATGYGGDLTFSVFPSFPNISGQDDYNTSLKYKTINKGFIVSPNYLYPVGQDAFKTFQQTQGNQFTTQKVGQVIGGVISTLAGLASLGSGNALGGVALAGGVASIGQAIASSGAKYSDLRNTPDTLSNIGGSAVHDYVINNTLHPYLAVYELTPSEKEMIIDYFYEYGYNVQRCCKFNLELKPQNYSAHNWVDERIFTRNNFNYVKLCEDITMKITSTNIPYIVKKKISDIFNKGITLWSWLDDDNAGDILTTLSLTLYLKDYENAEVY